MDIFNVFSLLGGLAMFLFGMAVMGDGLEKQAGGKLSSILEKLTSSRMKGFGLGLAVTAVIQSSSATTVMVVGFVNSGIMKLGQAIGIIMGANVGTTVTSWLLSLTGIQGDSFWVSLLKPSSFSPVLAFIGIIFYLFLKNEKKKDWGAILLGFAVLMFGMETMSSAVRPLADVPEFASFLLIFSNPVFGVLAGAIITGIIQSSSASVGILQALSATGSITYGTAVPIILGQNIGTCATALLSSIGANKNAKRAAVIHLFFNVIGTVVFLVLFYTLNAFLRFAFVHDQANAFGIAIVHTIFNIVSTAIMLPFCGLLEKIAYRVIPDKAEDEKETYQLLDERLLVTPGVAISRCRALADDMALLAQESIRKAVGLLDHYNDKTAAQVAKAEDTIDIHEDKLGSFLLQLSKRSLSEADSREVSRLLNTIGELERISDHAVNIMEVAQEMHQKQVTFSPEALAETNLLSSAVDEILDLAVQSFIQDNSQLARRVEPLEEVIDRLRSKLKSRHIARLQEGLCTIEMGFILTDLLTNYERVADHCSNIAICVIELERGLLDAHEYINDIKAMPDPFFTEQYKLYRQKYSLQSIS